MMTGTLWHLVLAVAVFLASHSLANRGPVRRRAEAAIGHRGFILLYSLLSVLLLAWMIAAYADAPSVVAWDQRPWMRWVPPLAMGPASILLAAGMASPNPFSIGPGAGGFDPARPGLLRLTRHPVLWGLSIWAGAHIVPNGDLAALVLFVPLLALALAGPSVLDARRRRDMGDEAWGNLARLTGPPPSAALRVVLGEIGWRRIALGPALYAVLFALHRPVIGLSPVP